MKTRLETLKELKSLNHKLDQITNNNHYFIYSTNPVKFAFYNFMAGLFHSLGTVFGTLAITIAIIYIISLLKVDLVELSSKFIQNSMSRIDWTKIIPSPSIDVNQFRLK